MKFLIIPVALAALAGCATFEDGPTQEITITSNAPGATCSLTQEGVQIAAPTATPATFDVKRRDANLVVTCNAPGYQPSTKALIAGKNPYSVTGHMWNSMLFGVVDIATGAVNEYQGSAYMHLKRQ